MGYEGSDPTLKALQDKADEIEEVGYIQAEIGEAVPEPAPEVEAQAGEEGDLESMTVEQLKDLARDREVAGFSTMNKAELIAALEE